MVWRITPRFAASQLAREIVLLLLQTYPKFLAKIPADETVAIDPAKNAGFSWRRRPAGGFWNRHSGGPAGVFFNLNTAKNRGLAAGATMHRASIWRIQFEREETKTY
jgi:hypothetical protein